MGFCLCSSCQVGSVNDNAINATEDGTDIPVKDRKRTDFEYFIILIIYLLFLIICVSVAGIQGDIRRLVHGYDDYGNICGYQNEPIENVARSGLDLREYNVSLIPSCASNAEKGGVEFWKSTFQMICLDILLCWKEIAVLCFLSICFSGLLLTLLRMFAKVVIWIVFTLVAIASILGAIYTWTMLIWTVQAINNNKSLRWELERDKTSWLTAAIFITLFTVIFFVMLFSLRKKMNLIAILFEEGGKCMQAMPSVLLIPVLTYLALSILTCFVITGLACFQTSGTAEVNEDGKVIFPVPMFFQIMRWVLFFGFIWLSQFFFACQNLIVASAASLWYFTRIKDSLVKPVWKSFRTVVKYHLGTATCGSLILAIIKTIRIIFKMFQKRSRDNNAGLMVIVIQFLGCLLACVESMLKFMTKIAYVMVVLYGEPFYISARKAFQCLSADCFDVAVVDGVGSFILTVIELLISASVTFIGVALFIMITDTLLLCFCVDYRINNGLERPYYMNKSFAVFLSENAGSNVEMSPSHNRNADNLQVIA